MSGTLNKVMLIGHLGDDIKMHYFDGGGCVGRFPLATNESYTNKSSGEKITQTEWHNIIVKNKAAEVCEKYIGKGDKIFIEGKLKTRKWQDQEGKDRYSTEVILQGYNCNLTLLDSRNQSNNSVESQSESMQDNSISDDSFGSNSSDSSDLDEDIPF